MLFILDINTLNNLVKLVIHLIFCLITLSGFKRIRIPTFISLMSVEHYMNSAIVNRLIKKLNTTLITTKVNLYQVLMEFKRNVSANDFNCASRKSSIFCWSKEDLMTPQVLFVNIICKCYEGNLLF